MNEQQRSTAAGDGSIVEHVIVEPVEPVVGTSRQAFYAVRVSREGDAPDVAIVPEPPHAQERGQVLMEAHRLLERRRARATMGADHQMLTRAIMILTRAIDALP